MSHHQLFAYLERSGHHLEEAQASLFVPQRGRVTSEFYFDKSSSVQLCL